MLKHLFFGKYSGKHSRLCLKLAYTAENECVEQLFPAWQPAILKLGILKTFSEEDSGTAIELNLKHIPFYCSVMFT